MIGNLEIFPLEKLGMVTFFMHVTIHNEKFMQLMARWKDIHNFHLKILVIK